MPKVLGILSNGDIRIHGGLFDRYPKQAIIEREICSIRFGANFCRHDMAMVYTMLGNETLIEAWVYADRTNYAGMIFGGEVWLRRIAFKDRAQWVPLIAAMPDGKVSHSEFYNWIAGEYDARPVNGS